MPARPDILLLMTDQQRWDSLGYAGNRFVRTPNLDRLAAGALRFRHAATPFPLCSPARAGLWTGLHAHRHGVADNIYREPDALAGRGRTTVFPALRAAGYRTGYVGKWHLGEARPDGFDHWSGYNSAASHWIDGAGARVWRPDRETDEAAGLLRDWSSGPPFLLVVSYYPPHPPYDAPDAELARYRGTGNPHPAYYAAVDALDSRIGRLLDMLAARRQARPAAVLFCSDHGETFRSERGSKRSTEEGAIRVPLLLDAPSVVPGDVDAPVTLLDVAPTLAGLAGLPSAGDGDDLLRIAAGIAGRRSVVIENVAAEPVATRTGNLRQEVGVIRRPERVVWTGGAKLVLREASPPILRDLAADPEERFNAWSSPSSQPRVRALLQDLEEHSARTADRDGAGLAAGLRAILERGTGPAPAGPATPQVRP
ncbi:sulfatase [Stella sp.]|uniref:sulfatase family protein n=1 Tax=Stella sp. TaxID=2912054 RepID=UPI0035ADEE51